MKDSEASPDTGREALAAVAAAIDANYDEDRYLPVYDEAGECVDSAAARAVLAALSRSPERATAGDGRCWRGECRTGCYYPEACSVAAALPAPAADDAPRPEAACLHCGCLPSSDWHQTRCDAPRPADDEHRPDPAGWTRISALEAENASLRRIARNDPLSLAALRLILPAAQALPCTCRPVDEHGPVQLCEACLIVATAAGVLG